MNTKGLTTKKAQTLLKRYGENSIEKSKGHSTIVLFIEQFTSPLVIILFVAACLSYLTSYLPGQDTNIVDTLLILIIVAFSGIAGFFQEYKAEQSIEALQKMSSPTAKVIRDGKTIEIKALEIVKGDLIILESGAVVPADAKNIENNDLNVDESSLTGESKQILKKKNEMVYMNSFIYTGKGKAVVTETGMNTKIGEIAEKLQDIESANTSFENEIEDLSKKISIGIVFIALAIFLVSLLKYSFYDALLTAVSLAVASIPEGLPATISLSLAVGARAMSSRNSLVRKLAVVESIGAVDYICTDKTGTLTKNEMEVVQIHTYNQVRDVSTINSKKLSKDLEQLFVCGALCNDVELINNEWSGDPTEIALLKASEKMDIKKEILEGTYKVVSENPFNSERKMMSVVVKERKEIKVYSKGAPEILIEKCNKVLVNGKIKKMTSKIKEEILEQNKDFSEQAMRVLGFAYKEDKTDESETNLVWIGLQAMIDPPREEAKAAIKTARSAGIKVLMITGDNAITAKAIGEKIGLESKGVVAGDQMEKMSKSDIELKLRNKYTIFARVSPFHKLKILEVLQKDYRVAMTGDGVNDSLALKKADVGIAMGINGTEVAKESSDIILMDDNFSSIIVAIKEGRKIFDNIRKFINYLLVTNIAEVAIIFIATLFFTLDKPILLPVQLLWINLLTDGMPALALGIDPARPNIMKEKPRGKDEPLINKKLSLIIAAIGIKKIIILTITFLIIYAFQGEEKARTALFTGFILYEFVRIASIRAQEKLSWFSNKWLLWALVASLILQLVVVYTPLQNFFYVTGLDIFEWSVLLIGIVIAFYLSIWITNYIDKRVEG